MNGRSGWFEGVLVPVSAAQGVSALLEIGLRWARTNALTLPDDVAEVVVAINAASRAARQRAANRPDFLVSSGGRSSNGEVVIVESMPTSEFALLAGCSRRNASSLAARGKFGAHRIGRGWYFDRVAAESALANTKGSA